MSKSVIITCEMHGAFEQRADMHVSGQNCPKCGHANRKQNFKETPRSIAKKEGRTTYWTGESCPKGHMAERRTRSGECVTCANEATKARIAKIKQDDPECYKQYKQTEYQKNREKHDQETADWRKKNPEKVQEMNRRWRLANGERFNEMVQDWRRRNPAATRLQKHRRRTLEESAEGSYTQTDIVRLLESQNGCCPGCDNDLGVNFTIDHKTPLTRGGTNNPENIQLLCRACNSSKGTQTDEEWRNRK